jgi:hypothetical protein
MTAAARPWLYFLPAIAATAVTPLLAVISVGVGLKHDCEDCGVAGAPSARTYQWLLASGLSVLALLLAWAAAGVVAVLARVDLRIRVVPLLIVVLFALLPAAVAGIAVGIGVADQANRAGIGGSSPSAVRDDPRPQG